VTNTGATASGDPDSLISIARIHSLPAARVLLSVLDAYGIHAFGKNLSTLGVTPTWMIGLGGIEVAVPQSQVDEALELLREVDVGPEPIRPVFSHNPWFNALITFGFGCLGCVPPPGLAGEYAWRKKPALRKCS